MVVNARSTLSRKLVGREDELAFLLARQRESGQSKGGLVVVHGDAGIGKSRLLRAFRAELAHRRVRVVESPCLQSAQRPFAPVFDILGSVDRAASDAVARGETARERFDALRDAFLRIAERNALVAIIEDAHWADAATLELLNHLGRRALNARLLMVVSSREPQLEHSDHVDRIHLSPLDPAQSTTVLDEALAGRTLPLDARRRIVRIAEGNPLYLEEFLRNTIEHGKTEVPPTLAAAVLERVAAFDPTARAVFETAAVLGPVVKPDAIAQLCGAPREHVLEALLAGTDRQIFEEVTANEFRFRHALSHEALYSAIPLARRAALHRRALALLTASAAPVEQLAHHAWNGREFAEAARYSEAAGDEAARLFAHDDAAVQYERALAALEAASSEGSENLPGRVRILERLAATRITAGSNQGAHEAYAAAAALLQSGPDREREAEMRVNAAVQAYRNGERNPTLPLDEMLARLDREDGAAATRLHVGIASLCANRYIIGEAERHLLEVDPAIVAERAPLRYMETAARATLAYVKGDAAAYSAAFDLWLAAAEAYEGGPALLVRYNGAMFFAILGVHDRARRIFADALTLARKQKDRMGESATQGMSALAHLATGELARVRRAVCAVYDLATDGKIAAAHAAAWGSIAALRLGDDELLAMCFRPDALEPFAEPLCAAGYAEALSRLGRDGEVQALLHRAIRYLERPRGMQWTALAVARYGRADDFEKAREILRAAADAPQPVVELPALALFDAYVARRTGDETTAKRLAAGAAERFSALGYPLLAAEALEVAGERERAVHEYERLGAAGDVRRLATPSSRRRNEPSLSPRELEIATLVADGLTNRAIAERCSISTKTVEKMIAGIFMKLGFSSRAQIAAYIAHYDDGSRPDVFT